MILYSRPHLVVVAAQIFQITTLYCYKQNINLWLTRVWKNIKRERGWGWGIEKEREVEPRKNDEYRRNCMCLQNEIEIEIVKKRQKEEQLVRKQSKCKSFPNVKAKYDIHTKRRKRNITDKTFCDFFPSNIFFSLFDFRILFNFFYFIRCLARFCLHSIVRFLSFRWL